MDLVVDVDIAYGGDMSSLAIKLFLQLFRILLNKVAI